MDIYYTAALNLSATGTTLTFNSAEEAVDFAKVRGINAYSYEWDGCHESTMQNITEL